MDITAQQLWERLQQSGLASPETCQSWSRSISLSLDAASRNDARQIASELIRTRKLTPYQCNTLFEQTSPRLQVGHYTIVDSLVDSLGANWIAVRDRRTNPDEKLTCWAFMLSPSGLQNPIVKQFPPSLQLAKHHIALPSTAPHAHGANRWGANRWELDRWGEIQTHAGTVLATCAPLPGISLKQRLLEGPLGLPQSIGLIRKIAEALKTLHDAGLVHGSLAPQAIWLAEGDAITLRRDILFPPSSPYFERSVNMLNLGAVERYAIAAPELSTPNSPPTPQSDLYALGVLWGCMLQGQYPWTNFAKLDVPGWKETHRNRPIDLPDLIAPHSARCLQHLTGKNPKSRFQSVDQFLRALQPPTTLPTQPAPPTETAPSAKTAPSFEIAPSFETAPDIASIAADAPELDDLFQPTKPVTAGSRKKARSPLGKSNRSAFDPSAAADPDVKHPRPRWLVPAAVAGSLLLLGGIVGLSLFSGGNPQAKLPDPSSASGEATAPHSAPDSGTSPGELDGPLAERFQLSDGDGSNLWLPPHPPDPIQTNLLPTGAELLLHFNGNSWKGAPQLTSLVPWIQESLPQWVSFTEQLSPSVSADHPLQEVLIALYPDIATDSFEVAVRFNFAEPTAVDRLLSQFQGYASKSFPGEPGKGIYAQGDRAVAFEGTTITGTDQVSSMVVGPSALLETLSETHGGSPPLRRQLEILLANSDRECDIYLLATSSFLKGNARSLLNAAPQLPIAVDPLVNERVQAISYAGRIAPQWYSEIRLVLTDAATLSRLSQELQQQLEQLPNSMEKSFANAPPPPYWSVIALRYPFMLRAVSKNVRWGVEDGQLIANAYLPTESIGNLVIGSWMSLQGSLHSSSGNATPPATVPASAPESIESLLDRPISIAFAQESLDMGLTAIATEFNDSVTKNDPAVEFVINGTAFQKEGITQNMQIRDFDHASQPLRTVLTDLVRRANPVTTVQSPTEQDQKVVWIVREDPAQPGKQRIELTTRSWASDNKSPLPPVFVAP